jgi:hypothetical protein
MKVRSVNPDLDLESVFFWTDPRIRIYVFAVDKKNGLFFQISDRFKSGSSYVETYYHMCKNKLRIRMYLSCSGFKFLNHPEICPIELCTNFFQQKFVKEQNGI